MNIKKLLSIIVLVLATSLAFSSCSKDDEPTPKPKVDLPLTGAYQVVIKNKMGTRITSRTEATIEIKKTGENKVSFDFPMLPAMGKLKVKGLKLTDLTYVKKGRSHYELSSEKQIVKVQMGAFTKEKPQVYNYDNALTPQGSVKDGVLKIDVQWAPGGPHNFILSIEGKRK